MYPTECFHTLSSWTGSPFFCWLRTWTTNSMKAITTSSGGSSAIFVGGLGMAWTYPYCLRTHSGKWRHILALPTMIHSEYHHMSWKGVSSRRVSFGLQMTLWCSNLLGIYIGCIITFAPARAAANDWVGAVISCTVAVDCTTAETEGVTPCFPNDVNNTLKSEYST